MLVVWIKINPYLNTYYDFITTWSIINFNFVFNNIYYINNCVILLRRVVTILSLLSFKVSRCFTMFRQIWIFRKWFMAYITRIRFLTSMNLCLAKGLLSLKIFLQISHSYGFSPVWILLWLSKWCLWLKVFLKMSHSYGFSPVWILLWLARVVLRLKVFLQISHPYGFSPVWILLWLVNKFFV